MSYINIFFLRKFKSREWLTWVFVFFAVFSFLEDSQADSNAHHIAGYVQNEDLRRVAQATVELRDQEGVLLMSKSTDDAGEFIFITPETGVFSIRAIQETYRSEYEIIEVGKETLSPVVLTMTVTQEIALEVVAPLLPIQPKSSSETYSLSRTEIEALPFGSNIEFNDALFTIPSAVNGSLKQVHIRQEHANLQVRIEVCPFPIPLPPPLPMSFLRGHGSGQTLFLAAWKRNLAIAQLRSLISPVRVERNQVLVPCNCLGDQMQL